MPEPVIILPEGTHEPADGEIIKLALLAVGGQGGGVLGDWIVDAAERSGYLAQSTSVAGVAQRTGATIYYIEMCRDTGRRPVFALSPAQGDVDILVAAELMEAGRAIMRGFVTPDRTTLIASSHRIAAVSEKIEPGDGRASSPKVLAAAEAASKRFVTFDMERIAVQAGSVISASLLGALAGSGALPFPRESYEAAIGAGGRGVKQSLAAFAGAYERAGGEASVPPHGSGPGGLPDQGKAHLTPSSATAADSASSTEMSAPPVLRTPLPGPSPRKDGEKGAVVAPAASSASLKVSETRDTASLSPSLRGEDGGSQVRGGANPTEFGVSGPASQLAGWKTLTARISALPEPVRDMAARGLKKVVDYQDLAYGGEYLDRLARAVALDSPTHNYALSVAAAKHLANAMCYDDMIRVADLKTRSTRAARVRREVGVRDENVLRVTEYFHPRIEEFCGTMPAGLGRYIEARPKFSAWLDRRINRGRHVRTDGFAGFATLWIIGGLRRWRRKLLRHAVETEHLERWYALALDHVATDYALAVEILECRRLIKGYSDTHARAQSKFERVLSGLDLVKGRTDAADWIRRLREAALKDEKGDMLDGALKTVASLGQ
ncbi:indolepyruvate oxidoreductase subunit beta family protein [Mesorhizobium sp. LHD-90]|uniref:indolepyruvate oxidoreductase subunit beta family protein n=1 Tax=Mesorhizobium sp. LHD-90 TaxID=3071414 RepID=UPI0027DEDEB5|nr:indolepyruvate oxidoreductase subunit beta family protein [Mesorhizobium sp. LHD-90]MDQ6436063.1 indolepyruvate oxidoreductase subunit beta family protein [Mesorhizobium sp. LHD-90]